MVDGVVFDAVMLAKMDVGEAIGLFVSAATLFVLFVTIVNSRHKAGRVKMARDFGLTADENDALRGARDGFEFTLEVFLIPGSKKNETRRKSRITISGGLPSDIHLGRSGVMAGLSNRSLASVEGHDVDIGSTGFDERYVIKGEPIAIFALLDAEARDRFVAALDAGWTFQKGAWTFEIFEVFDNDDAAARLETGLELARWLKERTCQELVPRMIERVHFDPEPGVRLRALEALIAHDVRRDTRVVALLEEMRHDEAPKVRLLSARGRDDADAIVAMVLDPEFEVRARLEALGEFSLMEDGRLMAVLSALIRGPGLEPVALRREALDMLERIGVEAEGIALDALEDREVVVQLGAVRALRAIGTAKAVPALRALAGPNELERAAKDAVLAIQDRIGADVGGLALAEPGTEAGALAVLEVTDTRE